MSKENISSDEVDLGNLFKVIGKGIQNFFQCYWSIFRHFIPLPYFVFIISP